MFLGKWIQYWIRDPGKQPERYRIRDWYSEMALTVLNPVPDMGGTSVPRRYRYSRGPLIHSRSGVFFTKGICARNIFKSWKMVPKANPENFVKIWSPEEEIWGFKDVRRCRFYFMDVNHSSSKRATNDSHKEHVHTLTLILMALVRPKVNSNGIKSIFRYFCMILFLH